MSENPNLWETSKAVLKARVESCDGEAIIKDPKILAETDFLEIRFWFGEIESVTTQDGKKLSKGMVVNISSSYAGEGVAVIIGFNFGRTQLPITISKGGADGELIACVSVREISFFPSQTGDGKVVALRLKV
ncbi:hypothetical protein CL630_04005 [bacterium]|nr:hypothetical protein [bacterium]|tara:strand:- start:241 stop:636 length:396 start_codon:yes stop_codon:yes gene_type:complete